MDISASERSPLICKIRFFKYSPIVSEETVEVFSTTNKCSVLSRKATNKPVIMTAPKKPSNLRLSWTVVPHEVSCCIWEKNPNIATEVVFCHE
jgi:hypothetical protein